ncbi:MAG: hypothetical protein A3D94_03460 [Alphaproteobacteria bacterium RIFCSPHIGHO2_12_FULL_66_14]|jgi:hypothetical protein|nr:MAG: hypothetical protein A3D94_03460 [Alphaproteobacteria bacterium RIFCSPHIGHO2_12_FULL_66_14]
MAAELSFAEVRRAVIAALERAADTLKRLPMPRNGIPAPERSSWPAILADPDDACGHAPGRPLRIPPAARAISELDRVLPWLATLGGTDRRLVWARAAGLSWSRLARDFGISVGRVRYRWNSAIDRIVAAAVHDTIVTGVTGSGAALRRRSCQTDRFAR